MVKFDEEAARKVRDKSIEAFDALNDLVVDVGSHLADEEQKVFRLAVARAMTAILENLLEPALTQYPSLEPSDSEWRAITKEQRHSK